MNPKDHLFVTKTLFNSKPIDDFLGLTPAEMHTLLYDPFSEGSVVQIKPKISDEVLNGIPIFRLAEALIAIMKREGFVKLTPLGLLNKKTLQELYNHKFYLEPIIEDGLYKLNSGTYWDIMSSCYDTLYLSGLIRKSKGKIFLTARANKLLDKGNRSELFRIVLITFILKFNWGVNDGYSDMQMLQQNAPFAIYLLYNCGKDIRPAAFYTDSLIKAYPKIPDMLRILDGEEDINSFHRCFQTRFFERFTEWFGFTESRGKRYSLDEQRQFKTTALFNEVFQFD